MTASGSRTPVTPAARRGGGPGALGRRVSMSPPGPAPDRLRVASWNLNSLRARAAPSTGSSSARLPTCSACRRPRPRSCPSRRSRCSSGTATAVHVGGRAYNGVAVAARHPIADVQASGELGDEHLDREPRIIACLVDTPVPVRVVGVRTPRSGRRPLALRLQAGLPRCPGRTGAAVAARRCAPAGRRRHQRGGDGQRRVPPGCLHRFGVRDAAEWDALAGSSMPASSMSTSPGGARMPGGSPGGTSASGMPATWACASMSSRPIGRWPPGSTRPGSTTSSGHCPGRPIRGARRRLPSHRGPNRWWGR